MSAPNRVLNLDEIATPEFQRVLAPMEALLARNAGAYLHPSKRWEYPWAMERVNLPPGASVLDAGCGASVFPAYLAASGFQVSALDLEPPFGLGQQLGVAIDYARGELTDMPYADAVFDAVFCISVIEHLGHEGVANAMAELRRVLKPGGTLLLTTDFYEDSKARLTYDGPGESFPVDWGFFDEALLNRLILEAPGWRVHGPTDFTVDWPSTRERMRQFHGYPYTSVGVALVRN